MKLIKVLCSSLDSSGRSLLMDNSHQSVWLGYGLQRFSNLMSGNSAQWLICLPVVNWKKCSTTWTTWNYLSKVTLDMLLKSKGCNVNLFHNTQPDLNIKSLLTSFMELVIHCRTKETGWNISNITCRAAPQQHVEPLICFLTWGYNYGDTHFAY